MTSHRKNMLIFTALCLVCWMLPAESMMRSSKFVLDMARKSYDNMYTKCHKDIWKSFTLKGGAEQKFADEWNKEKTNAENAMKKDAKELPLMERTAVRVYTNNNNGIYSNFNNQVRTGKLSSSYYMLHFYLTSAIQKLQSENKNKCHNTYRRTDHILEGKTGDVIRFGSFASSSTRPDQVKYGKTTCHKIETCYGAYFGDISSFPKEEEVLIPPYEKFLIEKVFKKGEVEELEDCETVYVLKSADIESNFECKPPKN